MADLKVCGIENKVIQKMAYSNKKSKFRGKLRQMITECDHIKVRHILTIVKDVFKKKFSTLSNSPIELLLAIYMTPSQSNRNFKEKEIYFCAQGCFSLRIVIVRNEFCFRFM